MAQLWHGGSTASGDHQHIPLAVTTSLDSTCIKQGLQCASTASVCGTSSRNTRYVLTRYAPHTHYCCRCRCSTHRQTSGMRNTIPTVNFTECLEAPGAPPNPYLNCIQT